jgi:hypothetical protein
VPEEGKKEEEEEEQEEKEETELSGGEAARDGENYLEGMR